MSGPNKPVLRTVNTSLADDSMDSWRRQTGQPLGRQQRETPRVVAACVAEPRRWRRAMSELRAEELT